MMFTGSAWSLIWCMYCSVRAELCAPDAGCGLRKVWSPHRHGMSRIARHQAASHSDVVQGWSRCRHLRSTADRHHEVPYRITALKRRSAVISVIRPECACFDVWHRRWCLCNRRGATLLIREARLNDTGDYTCHVTNVIGSAVSTANHVTVAEPGIDYKFRYMYSKNLFRGRIVDVIYRPTC